MSNFWATVFQTIFRTLQVNFPLGSLEMFESQEKTFFRLTMFMFLQKIHPILSEIIKHDTLF